MKRSSLPVTRVQRRDSTETELSPWVERLPCARQVLDHGLDLGPVTVLVGENGSGKSTLIEAIAQAYGLSPEGGSTGARHSTRVTKSTLGYHLQLRRGIGASRWGFFLRSETMHGFYTYLEDHSNGDTRPGRFEPSFHELSHGESFLEILSTRFEGPGLYVLDEPESALSFSGCLALVALVHSMIRTGTQQAVIATHSPVVAAIPGARIYAVDEDGLTDVSWRDLELTRNWTNFMNDPDVFLRYALAD